MALKAISLLSCFMVLILVSQFTSINSLLINTKCEKLREKLCSGLDYNMTSFPNSLTHLNQFEASQYISQFGALISIQCYEDIKLFLCSIFFPVCTSHTEPILPCRRFCKRARRGCRPVMKKHGFEWPEILRCTKFPKKSEQMCLEKPRQKKAKRKNKKDGRKSK